jgi:hypothetical protein
MKMYGSYSDEDLNDWQQFPLVSSVLTSSLFGAWLMRRDENKAKQFPTVSLGKVKQAREQIIDEKDFAYADFEQYKEEVLHAESDELPDDDFRYGMERCLEILDKLIAESEEQRR